MYRDTPLEAQPTEDQRERLQDFLVEVMALSRKYGMVIASDKSGEPPVVIDIHSDSIVGIDFFYVVDEQRNNLVTEYWCEDSILDGVWIVEEADGSLTEQRYWRSGAPPAV
jgi:hypothetical protein